jgi:carboxymethylenebutenolidase
MDMRTYIASELAEEAELGISSARADSPGYPGDPAVYVAEDAVTVSSNDSYYLARPLGDDLVPAVLVIHENKGLTEYVRNTARRLALRGYVAVAPDLLASAGGTAAFEPAAATKALAAIPAADIVAHLKTVVSSVAGLTGVSDRLGIVGFCYGGGIAWRMLTQDDRLRAGVPFYGPTPEADQIPNIGADTLAIYGATDNRITSMLPGIRETMAANGKPFEAIVYPGAGHAFHNDSNPDRYNAEAAAQAWEAAVHFLDKNLKS